VRADREIVLKREHYTKKHILLTEKGILRGDVSSPSAVGENIKEIRKVDT